MGRWVVTFSVLALSALPLSATTILYSQNFEGGVVPGQFSGGRMLNTAGVPSSVGDGSFALFNDSGGNPQGASGSPISFTLNGLHAFQTASLDFTFLAIDSWDGLDFYNYAQDFFNVQVNANLQFQASFRNYLGTHYSGDGTYLYETAPANSTITLLQSDGNSYLGTTHFNDAFYAIHLDNLRADANGILKIYFYANGSGWQGGGDESFAIDNLILSSPDGFAPAIENPEPGTWLTLAGGFATLVLLHRRKHTS